MNEATNEAQEKKNALVARAIQLVQIDDAIRKLKAQKTQIVNSLTEDLRLVRGETVVIAAGVGLAVTFHYDGQTIIVKTAKLL